MILIYTDLGSHASTFPEISNVREAHSFVVHELYALFLVSLLESNLYFIYFRSKTAGIFIHRSFQRSNMLPHGLGRAALFWAIAAFC